MAQTYTRQSSFADGDTITAALFNNEYNQLVNAFAYSSSSASSTGHRHDGTAGQGGNIHTIGDLDFLNKIVVDDTNNRWGVFVEVSSAAVEQIRIQDGAIVPVTDSDIDLGTTGVRFKDAYIDSVTTTGNVAVGGNLTVTGTTTFNGGTITMGDAATDNVVFGADVDSNIIPDDDNTYDLGSSSQEWKDLYVDGIAYLDGINFNGTAITSTAAELNILDGVTSTAAELNLLDGVTATTAELNILDGVTSTAAELNLLDGVTSTTAELNILDGVTASATDINLIDGITNGTVIASKAIITVTCNGCALAQSAFSLLLLLCSQNKVVPARESATNNAKLVTKYTGQNSKACSLFNVALSIQILPTKPDSGGIPTTVKDAIIKHTPNKNGCLTQRPATSLSPTLPRWIETKSANKNSAALTSVECTK